MDYNQFVINHSEELIQTLVQWLKAQDRFDIHFDFEEDDQWSSVTMHEYEEDKEVSLRMHPNKDLELSFGYYDEEDEFFEVQHRLTANEQTLVPEALKKLMTKVTDDEKGMRVSGKLITR